MSFDDNANKLAFVDLDGHLEMLSDDLANALRPAKENKAKQRLALCRYYKSGVKAGIPWEHLTSYLGDGDFFIFDAAEYTEEERQAVWDISNSLTEDEINKVELP